MKYKVKVFINGDIWTVEFENKPEMYKWLTKEMNGDKEKKIKYEISQIKGDEE